MNELKKIQSPHGKALGDCWCIINYFINLAIEMDEVVYLCTYYRKGDAVKRVDKLKKILPLFKHDDMIELTEEEITESKIHWTLGHKYPFISTKITWKPNNSKKICYQFDAKSKTAARFPSEDVKEEILSYARSVGYELVKLGHELTLEECIRALSESEFFLGLDSGFSTVAASVGIPVFFTQNNRSIEIWEKYNHSNKHFILARDYLELINNIKNYEAGGLNYYINNAKNIDLFKFKECHCDKN